ncbi:MAG: hypothetical protein KJ879_00645 [Nanoarchaeota archaeon]|nr:hypothetical protein [Nanoarchaeota archaeon]
MPQKMTPLEIRLPPLTEALTPENFQRAFIWPFTKKELITGSDKNRRFDGFKANVFSQTPYTDQNRPEKKEEDSITTEGGIELIVTTQPTTKRPAYEKIFIEFGGYLDTLLKQYQRGKRVRDIITIEEDIYVSTRDVIHELEEEKEKILEGKVGISQSLKATKPAKLAQTIPEIVSIVLGRDYSAFTDYNAEIFIQVTNFIEEADRRVKLFKEALKQDALKTLGLENPTDLTEVTPLPYTFGESVFIDQLEPRRNPSYGTIINSFISHAPKKLTAKSKVGDLFKAEMVAQGAEADLRALNLIDDVFISDYNPRVREDRIFIRLYGKTKIEGKERETGLIGRLNNYRENLVKFSIEQNIIPIQI